MIGRWIAYGLFLLGALLLQILYDGYLGGLLLPIALALPVLSLLLSVPALARAQIHVTPTAQRLQRGEVGAWEVSLNCPLPLPRLRIRLTIQNCLTQHRLQQVLLFDGPGEGLLYRLPMGTDQCGKLLCQVVQVRMWDYMGLFPLPLKGRGQVEALVYPVPTEPRLLQIPGVRQALEALPLPAGRGQQLGDADELRPYRPGDPLRTVHWKLSTKWEEWIVRQGSPTVRPTVLLTFDHFGPYQAVEKVLDELYSTAQALLERGYHCEIRWLNPQAGGGQVHTIVCQEDLLVCVDAILSQPLAPEGPSILEALPPEQEGVLHCHLTPEEVGP